MKPIKKTHAKPLTATSLIRDWGGSYLRLSFKDYRKMRFERAAQDRKVRK